LPAIRNGTSIFTSGCLDCVSSSAQSISTIRIHIIFTSADQRGTPGTILTFFPCQGAEFAALDRLNFYATPEQM
jgi:hypothetical protein